jgi:hypothetical protein
MRPDSPGEQVRIAIGGVLAYLFDIDHTEPLPDHLSQLLAKLDAPREASHAVMQLPPHRVD